MISRDLKENGDEFKQKVEKLFIMRFPETSNVALWS